MFGIHNPTAHFLDITKPNGSPITIDNYGKVIDVATDSVFVYGDVRDAEGYYAYLIVKAHNPTGWIFTTGWLFFNDDRHWWVQESLWNSEKIDTSIFTFSDVLATLGRRESGPGYESSLNKLYGLFIGISKSEIKTYKNIPRRLKTNEMDSIIKISECIKLRRVKK